MFISISELRQMHAAKRFEDIKNLFLSENTKINLPNNSFKQFYNLIHDKTPTNRYVCFAVFENSAARETPSKEPEYVFNIIIKKSDVTYDMIANIIKNSIECGMKCYISTASLRNTTGRKGANAYASSVIVIDLDVYNSPTFAGLDKKNTELKLLQLGVFLASINPSSAELNFPSTPFPLMGFHG